MDTLGVAALHDAAPCTGAGARRNFQRKRQRRLLTLRAGLATWGTEIPATCKVDPPPGLGFTRPAAHVEIDYSKFVFNLTDKDISTSTRDIASGTDTTYCDASCTVCPSTREATSGTATTYRDASSMAGEWLSLSDPIKYDGDTFGKLDFRINDPIDDSDFGNQSGFRATTPAVNQWERAHVVSGPSVKQARAHVVSGRVCSNQDGDSDLGSHGFSQQWCFLFEYDPDDDTWRN